MGRKKTTKRLVAEYADWLAERTPEELKALKVRFGVTVPSFKVTVVATASGVKKDAGPGSEGS